MEKTVSFKYYIPLIIVILSIFFLYWFSVRPSNIKKDCSYLLENTTDSNVSVQINSATESREGRTGRGTTLLKNSGTTPAEAELAYKKCLAEHGL